MQKSLRNYFSLMYKYPHFFENNDTLFQIITDTSVILEWQLYERVRLGKKHLPRGWATIGVVLSTPHFLAIRDLVRFPSGDLFGVLRILPGNSKNNFPTAVAVLPVIGSSFIWQD